MEKIFTEILSLKKGWDDGKGLSYDKESMIKVKKLIISLQELSPLLYFPSIEPQKEGGLLLEWFYKDWAISVIIDKKFKELEFHAINLETDDSENYHSDLELKKITEDDKRKKIISKDDFKKVMQKIFRR